MTTEYRVHAEVRVSDDGGYKEVTTDWDYRRDWIVPVAERLRDLDGANVEIHTREVGHHADFEEAGR